MWPSKTQGKNDDFRTTLEVTLWFAGAQGGRVLYEAIGGVRPAALVVVVGGFMIPSFQYDSYARSAPAHPALLSQTLEPSTSLDCRMLTARVRRALQGLGYSVLLFEDKSTITEPKPLKESVRVLLGQLKEAIQAHHQRALFSAAPSPADRVQSIKVVAFPLLPPLASLFSVSVSALFSVSVCRCLRL